MTVKEYIMAHRLFVTGEEFCANDICRNATTVNRGQVRSVIATMCERGELQKVKAGRYCAARPATKWLRRKW